jgi:hypothetical protein
LRFDGAGQPSGTGSHDQHVATSVGARLNLGSR